MAMREKLIDIINDFFGCDAAYYDVNPFDLATHLIKNGVTIPSENFIISPISQEEEEKIIKLLRECPVSVLPSGEYPTIEFIGHEYKWVSVKDRLPEENGEYLVYCGEYNGICVLNYEILKTKSKWRTKWKEVTHWMPLPKAPKEVL